MPARIQRERTAGWTAPLDAQGRKPVYVGRIPAWPRARRRSAHRVTPAGTLPVRTDATVTSTPAERLREAAATIRKAVADADREITTAYFSDYPQVARVRLAAPLGDYAALMHPGVGEALARWLELEADVIAARAAQSEGAEHAVDISGDHALADQILGQVTR